jgi:predicted GH43/DUF377 family glycosyl hydrolase
MKFQLTRYPSNEKPKPILTPRKEVSWEAKSVFNPSVIYESGIFRMLYRTFDEKLETTTPRLIRPGFYFKNQISYIGYAESKDGINFERRDTPFISPDTDCDRFACEDPRITKIGDTFYITYTAVDADLQRTEKDMKSKANVRIALATTKDFVTVTKHGIIGPKIKSKAAAFFPEPVKNGKIACLMTVDSDSGNSRVVTKYYDSLDDITKTTDKEWDEFLADNKPTLKTEWWLQRGPELGAAPVKTDRGWLIIFSNESMSASWTIGAALFDLNDPDKLIARTSGSILQPVTDYEREGLVPNVTFPEGAVIVGDELFVYYGAADSVIGLATCKLKDLLDYIESFKK